MNHASLGLWPSAQLNLGWKDALIPLLSGPRLVLQPSLPHGYLGLHILSLHISNLRMCVSNPEVSLRYDSFGTICFVLRPGFLLVWYTPSRIGWLVSETAPGFPTPSFCTCVLGLSSGPQLFQKALFRLIYHPSPTLMI